MQRAEESTVYAGGLTQPSADVGGLDEIDIDNGPMDDPSDEPHFTSCFVEDFEQPGEQVHRKAAANSPGLWGGSYCFLRAPIRSPLPAFVKTYLWKCGG